MEKASSDNNNNSKKLSKMLQKALSIGHNAAPFSPVRDFRHHRTISTASRGYFFSSPITPLLPTSARARRRTKSSGGVVAEPTSPKVSCIGQIKLAKSKCPEKKNTRAPKNLKTSSSSLVKEEKGKGGWSKLKRLFSTVRTPSSRSTASAAVMEHPVVTVEAVTAPSLGTMKKFATNRESLGGFDWRVEMNRREPDSDDEEEVIPCSVSMPLSQREGLRLCPRQKSEVNLWERRTMNRPKPLQVKASY